jgi:S-adenosylmethionine synthetase
MFEKVNPHHPDKIADRIAGAVVDIAYKKQKNPHIAVEVMIGHSVCFVMIETDVSISKAEVRDVVLRISPEYVKCKIRIVAQDMYLALNQTEGARCGDNGIFAGSITTLEQKHLTDVAGKIYIKTYSDGKYLIDERQEYFGEMTICQSRLSVIPHSVNLSNYMVLFNPLGN